MATEVSTSVYYALLDNETISYWFHTADGSVYFFLLIYYLVIGGAIGMIAGIVIVIRKEANSKYG
jgi:hypothetical protein